MKEYYVQFNVSIFEKLDEIDPYFWDTQTNKVHSKKKQINWVVLSIEGIELMGRFFFSSKNLWI